MNYFVSTNVYGLNNGPEFSSYERLRAFNENGMPAKLVLLQYSQYLSMDLSAHCIDRKYVINMYDYFQNVVNEQSKPVNSHHLPSLPFKDYHLTFIDNNKAGIDWMGHRKALIHYAPNAVAKVGSIDYYDKFDHIVQTEHWDWRGFLSRVDNYHPDGSLATSRYLRKDGSTALVVTHMNINNQVMPTMWKLIDYKGHNFVFDTEHDLIVFFLNELNKQERSTFFADRRIVDNAVLQVKDPLSRVAVIHDIPVKNSKHPDNSPLLDEAKVAFNFNRNQINNYDHIVFSTNEQREIFKKRFQKYVPNCSFDVANDSYVSVNKDQKPLKIGDSLVVAYKGLLGRSKHTIDLVKAFKDISKRVSVSQLRLQGYFENAEEEKEIKDLAKKLKVNFEIVFNNYKPYDDSAFNMANFFINASQGEAFGMNALEAMAHGIPVVTYNVPFIANNLVKNNVNGILLQKRKPKAIADKTIELMGDKELYSKLSAGAIATAKQYTKEAMVKDWESILA